MNGTPAIYLGRIVDKKNFRAFIYGKNGEKKLVESWDEFEANIQTGIWFASHEDIVSDSVKPKLKAKRKPKSKANSEMVKEIDEPEDISTDDDGMVFEVTEDKL